MIFEHQLKNKKVLTIIALSLLVVTVVIGFVIVYNPVTGAKIG